MAMMAVGYICSGTCAFTAELQLHNANAQATYPKLVLHAYQRYMADYGWLWLACFAVFVQRVKVGACKKKKMQNPAGCLFCLACRVVRHIEQRLANRNASYSLNCRPGRWEEDRNLILLGLTALHKWRMAVYPTYYSYKSLPCMFI